MAAALLWLGLLVGLSAGPASAQTPVAHWRLDDGSGPTAIDSAGSNDGTLMGAPVWTAGQVGGGLELDGVDDFIDTPYTSSPGQISFTAWVRPDAAGNEWARLVQKQGELEVILETTNNRIVFGHRFSGGWGFWTTADQVFPDDTWSHVALVYDRSSSANDPAIYVDGAARVATETSAPSGTAVSTPSRLTLGALAGGRRSLDGTLDEIKLFDVALSGADVLSDYNAGLGPDTAPPSVPANLSAIALSEAEIDLAWSASSDDVGVTGYNVYRDGALVVTVVSSAYRDGGLSPGTSYTYNVSAIDAAGNESGLSLPASDTTLVADTDPPTSPSNVVATSVSPSEISLAWTASADDVGVTGYTVYENGTPIASTATTDYTATGLFPDTSYTYVVTALDAAGNESAPSAPATFTTISRSPAAHWRLDDGSGTTALDASGNGYHGLLSNGPVWTTGQVGGGLQLDGVDDLVATPYTATPGEISLVAWVRPDAASDDWTRLVYKQDEFELILETTNDRIVFGQSFSGGWGFWRSASQILPPDTWSHVALVYDRTSSANDPILYVDGVALALTEGVTPGGSATATASPVTLGAFPSGRRSLMGIIDEIKIFDSALTATEVQADFSGGSAPDTVPPVVAIRSLASGSVVSHQMTIAAEASDNVGVVGVQFRIDGADWGPEDTTRPFSIDVATRQLPDGVHTLEAQARDAAGLTALSPPIDVNVDNTTARPSIVLIMTDDQRWDSMQHMPLTESLFSTTGVRFDNATVTSPICCPSRASFLTSLYAHFHGVLQNQAPLGGATAFDDESTLATWLESAGYRTGLYGKYLNETDALGTYVPPGWSEWEVFAHANGRFYNYNLNENGVLVPYGSSAADYSTDRLVSKASQFIGATPADQPFFLFVSVYAPHEPYTPAPADVGSFSSYPDFRPPAFNEADVSDKPSWVQSLALRTATQIAVSDANHRAGLESLQAVDRGVEGLVNALLAAGRLDDTLIVFTSDNGLSWGEHRWFDSKNCVYEECIRVPLWVYKEGTAARSDSSLVQNIDLAPTFSEWAGVVPPVPIDGESFLALLDDPSVPWRTESLIETLGLTPDREYQAVRTDRYVYAEYANGDTELYDLALDPDQLTNRVADPAYATLVPTLQAALDRLRTQPSR